MSELQQDELDRMIGQMKAEEIRADDARLSSLESLQAWMQTHPVLQKLGLVDAVHQYGPALLQIIQRLLGA